MMIKLGYWQSGNGFERVYINGLPCGKAWLQAGKGGFRIQFEKDSEGMPETELLEIIRSIIDVHPSNWKQFVSAVQQQATPSWGRAAGKMASSRRSYEPAPSEWTEEHARELVPSPKTHPLTKPTTILLDDREPAEMVDLLRTVPNLHIEIGSWETGDYIVPDKLIIERKTAADFAASIIDKRLFSQTERMASSGMRAILLIEGNVYQQTTMSLESITGALSFLAAIQGLCVIGTISLEHTAHMIVKLTRHAVEGLGYEIDLRGAAPKDPSGAAVFVLQGIPGISAATASELLKTFGSIAALANADLTALRAVPGIGPTRAKAIFETLRAGTPS